jgi:hypothetical protein
MMQQDSIVRTGVQQVSDSHGTHILTARSRWPSPETALEPMAPHKLTVADPMKLRLPSACTTAQGDKGQPDQSVHLATAILLCGFRSVMALCGTPF